VALAVGVAVVPEVVAVPAVHEVVLVRVVEV